MTKNKTLITILSILLVSICIIMMTIITIKHTATTHGMTIDTHMSLLDMMKHNKLSHTESVLPDDINGAIIIYYKYACPDCETIYNDLTNILQNNPNVYWVSTESEQGLALLEQYPVTDVPSAIYIRYNDYNGNIKHTIKSLYNPDTNTLDETAINRLLYLQEEQR